MTWIDQNALWLVLMCVISTAILVGGWIQTGRKVLLYVTALPVILGILILIVQQVVVSEQEEVRQTLNNIARALEQNDVDAVLAFVDAESLQVVEQARRELPQYDFGEITIKQNLEVTVDSERDPPQAVAEFNVAVVVGDRGGAFEKQRIPRFAIVTFIKRDGRWRVAKYEHHPPQQGSMRRDDPPDF